MIHEFEILYYKSKTYADVFGEISATTSAMRMNEKLMLQVTSHPFWRGLRFVN
jgi:hypothetical protein